MGVQTALEQETFVVRVDKHYTAQDFESLPPGPPYYELINNRLVMVPSPEIPHQRTSLSLVKKIDDFVEQRSLGLVLEAPMDVELDEDNVFQPDILFISNERLGIIQDGRKIKGAPDLVVEILSSNKKYDQEEKKYVYELHDVREFWLIDTKKKTVEVFENQRKEFVSIQKAYLGDTVRSKLLAGFEIATDYLFREIPKP
jgi:Uma2 family endonuclease